MKKKLPALVLVAVLLVSVLAGGAITVSAATGGSGLGGPSVLGAPIGPDYANLGDSDDYELIAPSLSVYRGDTTFVPENWVTVINKSDPNSGLGDLDDNYVEPPVETGWTITRTGGSVDVGTNGSYNLSWSATKDFTYYTLTDPTNPNSHTLIDPTGPDDQTNWETATVTVQLSAANSIHVVEPATGAPNGGHHNEGMSAGPSPLTDVTYRYVKTGYGVNGAVHFKTGTHGDLIYQNWYMMVLKTPAEAAGRTIYCIEPGVPDHGSGSQQQYTSQDGAHWSQFNSDQQQMMVLAMYLGHQLGDSEGGGEGMALATQVLVWLIASDGVNYDIVAAVNDDPSFMSFTGGDGAGFEYDCYIVQNGLTGEWDRLIAAMRDHYRIPSWGSFTPLIAGAEENLIKIPEPIRNADGTYSPSEPLNFYIDAEWWGKYHLEDLFGTGSMVVINDANGTPTLQCQKVSDTHVKIWALRPIPVSSPFVSAGVYKIGFEAHCSPVYYTLFTPGYQAKGMSDQPDPLCFYVGFTTTPDHNGQGFTIDKRDMANGENIDPINQTFHLQGPGIDETTNLPITKTDAAAGTYTLTEVTAPFGYWNDPANRVNTFDVPEGGHYSMTVSTYNTTQLGQFVVHKVDNDDSYLNHWNDYQTGTSFPGPMNTGAITDEYSDPRLLIPIANEWAQGDASFVGAEFTIYAGEDIIYPAREDRATIAERPLQYYERLLWVEGEAICTITTGSGTADFDYVSKGSNFPGPGETAAPGLNGNTLFTTDEGDLDVRVNQNVAISPHLPLGKYYVKETALPEGYQYQDYRTSGQTIYIDNWYTGQENQYNRYEFNYFNSVIKGHIELTKFLEAPVDNDLTDPATGFPGRKEPAEGIYFGIYLNSKTPTNFLPHEQNPYDAVGIDAEGNTMMVNWQTALDEDFYVIVPLDGNSPSMKKASDGFWYYVDSKGELTDERVNPTRTFTPDTDTQNTVHKSLYMILRTDEDGRAGTRMPNTIAWMLNPGQTAAELGTDWGTVGIRRGIGSMDNWANENASAMGLPYGKYTVIELNPHEGYEALKFDVDINSTYAVYAYGSGDSGPHPNFPNRGESVDAPGNIVENGHFGKLYNYDKHILGDWVVTQEFRLYKVDNETDETIPQANIKFKIWSWNNVGTLYPDLREQRWIGDSQYGHWVTQTTNYPTPATTDIFATNSDGWFQLEEPLAYGDYTIVELNAPTGYWLPEAPTPELKELIDTLAREKFISDMADYNAKFQEYEYQHALWEAAGGASNPQFVEPVAPVLPFVPNGFVFDPDEYNAYLAAYTQFEADLEAWARAGGFDSDPHIERPTPPVLPASLPMYLEYEEAYQAWVGGGKVGDEPVSPYDHPIYQSPANGGVSDVPLDEDGNLQYWIYVPDPITGEPIWTPDAFGNTYESVMNWVDFSVEKSDWVWDEDERYWHGTKEIFFRMQNENQKGYLVLEKKGIQFTDTTTKDVEICDYDAYHQWIDEHPNVPADPKDFRKIVTETNPVYTAGGLEGAVYELRAAEDIITPEGTLRHREGDLIETLTTDGRGLIVSEPHYLGKYTIQEIKAPYGYILDTNIYEVEWTYKGQEIRIFPVMQTYFNVRQNVRFEVYKLLEIAGEGMEAPNEGESTWVKADGVAFGLYTREDIYFVDGVTVGLPADTLVEVIKIVDGKGQSSLELPLGKYYLKEICNPPQYIQDQTEYDVEFKYTVDGQEWDGETQYTESPAGTGAGEILIIIKCNDGIEIRNELIRGNVELEKYDYEYDQGIPDGLIVGDEVSREVVNTDSVTGAVTTKIIYESGDVTTELLITETRESYGTEVEAQVTIKGAATGTEEKREFHWLALAGAEFTLFDEHDVARARIVTDENGFGRVENVPFGRYIMRETKYPLGYVDLSSDRAAGLREQYDLPIEWVVIITKDGQTVYPYIYDDNNNGPNGTEWKKIDNVLDKPYVEIIKTNESGTKRLKGVEFELYSVDNLDEYNDYLRAQADYDAALAKYMRDRAQYLLDKRDGLTPGILPDFALTPPTLVELKMTYIETLTTDENGLAYSNSLEDGHYFIKETKSVGDYVANFEQYFDVYVATMERPYVISYTVKNELKTVIELVKQGPGGERLANATFEVLTIKNAAEYDAYLSAKANYDAIIAEYNKALEFYNLELEAGHTGATKPVKPNISEPVRVIPIFSQVVSSFTTDGNGVGTSAYLEDGEYLIRETKNPDGYHGAYEARLTVNTKTMKTPYKIHLTVTNTPNDVATPGPIWGDLFFGGRGRGWPYKTGNPDVTSGTDYIVEDAAPDVSSLYWQIPLVLLVLLGSIFGIIFFKRNGKHAVPGIIRKANKGIGSASVGDGGEFSSEIYFDEESGFHYTTAEDGETYFCDEDGTRLEFEEEAYGADEDGR